MNADAHIQIRQTIVRLLSSMASSREIDQYLKRFAQLDAKRFAVVKVGGAVLRDDLEALTSSLAFLQQVGLTPKAYARVVRFTAAAARVMEDPSSRLADVSNEAGYFDQSHMIRDFLAFAGASPEALRLRLGQMTAWMLAARPR